ncbi:MAG: hypothetical protein J7L47_11060 [Candidatus Odinarchaeota archaeon]|nr:hypothetical protein [Candidatus Odinarchaeota archaeon]
MIVGYLVLTETGIPLFSREFVPYLSKKMQSFTAPIISALTQFSTGIVGQEIKHIEMESFHIYLRSYDRIIVAVFSDIEDSTVNEFAESLGQLVFSKLQDIKNLEAVQFNSDLMNEIMSDIEELLKQRAPAITYVEKLALEVSSAVDHLEGSVSLPIKSLKPKRFKMSLIDSIRRIFGSTSIETILNLYYDGMFEDVVKEAPKLYSSKDVDVETSDFAKALYVKAGLMLNSYDPAYPAPSLEELYTITESIKDTLLKQLLKATLKGYSNVGAYNETREIILQNRQMIINIINASDLRSYVYGIVATPAPDVRLLNILMEKFKTKSEMLYAFNYEMKELLGVFFSEPESVSSWMRKVAVVKDMNKKIKNPLAKLVYQHLIFFINYWGLLLPDLTTTDGETVIESLLKFWDDNGYPLIANKAKGTNRHKSVIAYFALGSVLNIALSYYTKPKAISLAQKYKPQVLSVLSWIRAVGVERRENMDMYYTSAAVLLAAASQILWELGEFSKDIPAIVQELTKEEIENFWELNKYHYAHFTQDF